MRHNVITGHPASVVAEEGSVTRSHSNVTEDLRDLTSAGKSGADASVLDSMMMSPRGSSKAHSQGSLSSFNSSMLSPRGAAAP